MKKLFALLFFFLVVSGAANAQKRYANVKTVTEYEEVFEKDGKEPKKIKKSVTTFDQNGNAVEEIEFEDNGKVKSRTVSSYDAEGNHISDIIYNPDGTIDDKVEYKYNGRLRIEKSEFGAKGKIKKRKTYQYEMY
ncbi:MAG: hypothetical protein MJ069_05555 [Salinivirgaceae bacterium]|nr:hypothetical protein [Salinivirgaceae bacterium]